MADVLETAGKIKELEESDSELPRLQAELFDGKTVFLCWRSDESELAWYRPIEEGYQGRRPLPKTSPVE